MSIISQNNKKIAEESNLTALMDEVLAKTRSLGATNAAVSVSHDHGFSVDVRMHSVETVAFNEDKSVSLVVYFGQRKGSASTTDTSSAALTTAVEAACDIAKVSSQDPCFGLADRDLLTVQHPDLDLYHPWSIEPSQAIEQALACEEHALSLDKRITNSDGVNLSTYSFCHGYADTHGARGFVRGTRHSLSCSLIAENSSGMQTDYDYTTSRRASQLVSLEQLAQSTVDRTVSRLGARKLKTGKTPVLFSSRVSSSLMSSFISAISGSNLYRKNSFLLDSLGKTVFPEWVRIYEQPRLLGALGSAPFDGEGVPTRHNVFVHEGRVEQYVLGSYSARRLGLQTTANSDGVHNLTVDANAGELSDLIKTMDKGLLVTELMGQGVNGLTGDYSKGATGFWVEHGEIQYPVEEITIANNLKEMFLSILAIGQDINPNHSTRCGSILIGQMMVAGE